MSIEILTKVYDEVRRLAIAGSAVAGNDTPLRKLIGALEKSGANSPVLKKIATAAKTFVGSKKEDTSHALLELVTLVNAVLQTQGETGLSGKFQSIETTSLEVETTQVSGRVVKNLLEALAGTGTGRTQIVEDAYHQGVFRDVRLAKPALAAINDPNLVIVERLCEKVLPKYGVAIVPELRRTFDLNGSSNEVHRLILMNRLDPKGTRAIIEQVLEAGSQPLKIAAIRCLGTTPGDFKLLMTQTQARAKDLKLAVFGALAKFDSAAAFELLKPALANIDFDHREAIRTSPNQLVHQFIIEEMEFQLDSILAAPADEGVISRMKRLDALFSCISGHHGSLMEAFVIKYFERRGEISRINSRHISQELNDKIVKLMIECSPSTRRTLAYAHSSLDSKGLRSAFVAACESLKSGEVFLMFSPYLAGTFDGDTTPSDEWTKSQAIAEMIISIAHRYQACNDERGVFAWDSRWIDLAIKVKAPKTVLALANGRYPKSDQLFADEFNKVLDESKYFGGYYDLLTGMVRINHPGATECLIRILKKHAGNKAKVVADFSWIERLIPQLPKSAARKFEESFHALHQDAVERLIQPVATLTSKPPNGS